MGSIAIALRAEYGEFWPSAISLTGRSWTKRSPAADSQGASRGRSEISPIPQLRRDGIENSGTSAPAWRPLSNARSDIRPLHHAPHPLDKRGHLRQQADDEVRLVREIEEEPGVHQHVAREQIEDEILLASRRGHAK